MYVFCITESCNLHWKKCLYIMIMIVCDKVHKAVTNSKVV